VARADDTREMPDRRAAASIVFLVAALAPVLRPSVDRALAATTCQGSTIIAPATADSWIDQSAPSVNRGSDPILNVRADPPGGNARALVRFRLPGEAPAGCVVESARLRLFSPEENVGSRVEAARLAAGWAEGSVTWSGQPGTTGPAAAAWSREGYMRWNVTSQVAAMLQGANHGFLIRDAAEGAGEMGGDHGFHSREKGDGADPPELVIHFAAPPSGGPPGPPAPPAPATVRCGQVLTASTRVTNDLSGCPSDGLVIGADRIIIDLGGHTIDGVGLGAGILGDGYASVTVRNGTVQEFDHGVLLLSESELNAVERLTLQRNQLAGIELFDAADSRIRANVFQDNGDGIALVSGTRATLVADNTVTLSAGASVLVRDSNVNRIERNGLGGGGDLGIGLERASGNTLLGNTVTGSSDAGVVLATGSNGNRVEGNTVRESGDAGIRVVESHRNQLISNIAHLMSDSGITLESADDGVVRGNDVRFNPGGLQVDGSSRNLIEANNASETAGYGIELGGGSFDNDVLRNSANANDAAGIYVADEALTDDDALTAPGNRLAGNTASGNVADGIVLSKGGHRVAANIARGNGGWGINVALGTVDGGGNVASGNVKPEQCVGVVCTPEPPCTPATATVGAVADGWVGQSAPSGNHGGELTLRVIARTGANARALVRFELPAVPTGCDVVEAKLRLYSSSFAASRTLQALALAAPWTESGVTWMNQPATIGAAASAPSRSSAGYVAWTVTAQARRMYAGGNHGFLVRDGAEGGGGAGQGFNSRERGATRPPLLVVTFG
jgi:large repetitive protein